MILRTITHTMPHYRVFYRIVEGRKQEISRRLVSEDSSTNSTVAEAAGDVERSAADYFGEMGVEEPVPSLMATTPSGSAHWLTPGELLVSGLATHFIDGPRPIHYGAGLNGLKGSSMDGGVTSGFQAEGAVPLTLGDQRSAEVNIGVRYRTAGRNALVDLTVRDPVRKEAIQAGKNGALLVVGPKGPAFAALPRTSG
jgi:hypothetical protein